MPRPRMPALTAVALAAGCSSGASGTLQLVTGAETDTFTAPPAPVKLEVDVIDSTGTSRQLATATLPVSNVDLGSLDQSAAGIVQVSAFDDGGTRVLGGQTIPFVFGLTNGGSRPVFVQRTGQFARLPNPPKDSRQGPVVGVIEGQYAVVTGGTDPVLGATTMVYDLAFLQPVTRLDATTGATVGAFTLPRTPLSMAIVGLVAWLIDGAGVSQFDFSSQSVTAVTLPTGAGPADIAGGATVTPADGSAYVVGASRASGTPSGAVLAIDSSGNPSWATLAAARLGAAAAWVSSRGLVVAGGNPTEPGIELIAFPSGAKEGAPLSYPSDSSSGAGAAALDQQHVLVAGGVLPDGSSAGTRVIDLSCTTQCAPATWPALPVTLVHASAFAIDSGSAIVVGSEGPSGTSPGLTHAFRVDRNTVAEIATRAAHVNASAVASPIGVNGSVLVFGGAPEIESLGL